MDMEWLRSGVAPCDCEPPTSTSVPVPEHMQPIIPISRKEPFDGDGWLFELKLDDFRGLADTVQGRMRKSTAEKVGRQSGKRKAG